MRLPLGPTSIAAVRSPGGTAWGLSALYVARPTRADNKVLAMFESPARGAAISTDDGLAPGAVCVDPRVIETVNPLEDSGWEGKLASHPEASVFHSAAWARVLNGTYGLTPVYFAAAESGRLLGLLPCMEVNGVLRGRRGVSLPFTDTCAPLDSPAISTESLLQAAQEYGTGRRWRSFEYRGGLPPSATATPSVDYFGHVLDLRAGPEHLLAGCASAVRRALRKAEGLGVRTETAHSLEATRTYFELHCQTRRKHGLPPQPFAFFRLVQQHLLAKEMGFVCVARHAGKPIAAAIFLHYGNQAIYKFGASDEAALALRGNNLVMWEGIRHLAARGFQTLHFGRTSRTNEGLRRFKLGWGAVETVIRYFKYDYHKGAFVSGRDSAQGWYNQVFRWLPTPVSRLIGAVLYRHTA